MLGTLRKFSRGKLAGLLVVIIIIPFVFWGMGSVFTGGNSNNVAKINKNNISVQDFMEHIKRSNIDLNAIKRNIDKNILDEFLSQLISLKIIEMEINDLSLLFTEDSLLKNIIKDKKFLNENKSFSRILYEKYLIENNISSVSYEKKLKESQLENKLFEYVGGGIIPPKFLIKNLANALPKIAISIISFCLSDSLELMQKEYLFYFSYKVSNYF